MELTPIIESSFGQYAGAVLQSRALVDVRDFVKPSARQVFYCMYTDKFTCDKPFKKTLKAIGSAMRLYIHGNDPCEGIIMKAGQPFYMRYPLVEVDGAYGNLLESKSWSAARYTSSRLSGISNNLFKFLDKETINDWRDNYDDTEQYPAVLPSPGFYNIVNGALGIGVGASSSIPPTNLTEVNNALIKLLHNRDCDFDEIYCVPDFPTGGILMNPSDVKESFRKGQGKSCKIRAKMIYDDKEKVITVTEIPYGVYTNTLCKELEKIEDSDDNPGIVRHNDLTGDKVELKIYLNKKADVEELFDYLYKNTSLESHYTINLTMLDEGRYPKVFTWKEALLAYIDHQRIIFKRAYEYDKRKAEKRIHILDGYLLVCEDIENVISIIKKSKDKKEASANLKVAYPLDDEQVEAILKLTLSRIASLEVEKFAAERRELLEEVEKLVVILSSQELMDKGIEQALIEVRDKYGDKRRTDVIAHDASESEADDLSTSIVYINRDGSISSQRDKNKVCIGTITGGLEYIAVSKKGVIYRSKERSKRTKTVFKLDDDDYLIFTTPYSESRYLAIVTEDGKFRVKPMNKLGVRKTTLSITNLKEVYLTDELPNKTNYKSLAIQI